MVRTIEELDNKISEDVIYAIELFTSRYGAGAPHDSGHKTRPTWIYSFPSYGGAQVGIRMNKTSLTLYLRDKTRSGTLLSEFLPEDKITKKYPRDGSPASSIVGSSYLQPSISNPVLLVNLLRQEVRSVLDVYFGLPIENDGISASDDVEGSEGLKKKLRNWVISAEEFAEQLNRKSEIGNAGERIAILDEIGRLRSVGCLEPEKYVSRIALTDVGRGYDIESVFPSEERYIEVKTSTTVDSDFFLSDNERKTLASLGEQAWLYRVHVRENNTGEVLMRIQNPMNVIKDEAMLPVIWRVNCTKL